jgi:methionyl-tRNA synthetase
LVKMSIDLGGEKRQIVAGIGEAYQPEDLVGKTIVVVANLAPAKIRGVESRGMLLAAVDGDGIALVTVDRETKAGCEVS